MAETLHQRTTCTKYEAPRAVRLSDTGLGEGGCFDGPSGHGGCDTCVNGPGVGTTCITGSNPQPW